MFVPYVVHYSYGEETQVSGAVRPAICGAWTSRKTSSGALLSNGSRWRTGTGLAEDALAEDRKRIGEDINTAEFGWPIGMPVCRALGEGIYEVRTTLMQNRIARVLFYIDRKGRMVLLHAFIKKTQKTPGEDMELARSNKSKHQRGLP